MPQKKGIKVDVLIDGAGGELVFAPVEIKKRADVKKLLETKNAVIRENLKRELKLQKATA